MIKILCKILFFVTIFFLGTVLADVAGYEKVLKLGIRNYNKAHYRNARYCFGKALKEGLKDERLKFVRYALKTMDDFKAYIEDVEREEKVLKAKGHDEYLENSLFKKHLYFAVDLMKTEFYLPMVEPHLKRAIELNPKSPDAHFILGNAYYTSMRYTKAIEGYDKAISLDPGNLYYYKMAGDASVAIGDFDKAKKFYLDLIKVNEESILRYDPSEIEKINRIIKVLPETYKEVDDLLKDGKTDEAEAILKKRISLNSADHIAITTLGYIYQDKGDRKSALNLFKTAIKIAPDYPIAHLYLGRLYFLMRRPEEAISELKLFKEKMALLPKMDDETKKMYINGLYYTGEVYFTLKRYEDFRKEIEEILKLDPNDQYTFYNLGIYYYVSEHNRSKAYESFKKVIELEPTTFIAKRAKYNIEYMRSNPDSRFIPDLSFIDREYREE